MNPTIQNQLNHRSIRKFKDIPLTSEEVNLLVDVAQHTSTSSFMQSYSILSVTDPEKKTKVAQIGNQNYIAECGHLFIMLADQHRNQLIAEEQDTDTEVLGSFDRFFVAATDAILAAQNIMVAAEAMGLGGVFLGSTLNQVDQLIEIFNLPVHVVPVLGIAIGQLTQLGDLSEQSKHGVCTGSAVRSCDEVRIRVFPRYSNHQPMHISHGYITSSRKS